MNPTLTNAAANLKRRAVKRNRHMPSLWLMSDEIRLPDPEAAMALLPRGAGLILRHYTTPDRAALAGRLAVACRRRGVTLLIGGDWRLAAKVGASGIHLPEHAARRGPSVGARLWMRGKRRYSVGHLMTAAAHGSAGLRRAYEIRGISGHVIADFSDG